MELFKKRPDARGHPYVAADRRHVFFKCGAHTKPAIEPRARSPGSSWPKRHQAFSAASGGLKINGSRAARPRFLHVRRPLTTNHGHLTLLSIPFPKHLSAVSSVFSFLPGCRWFPLTSVLLENLLAETGGPFEPVEASRVCTRNIYSDAKSIRKREKKKGEQRIFGLLTKQTC